MTFQPNAIPEPWREWGRSFVLALRAANKSGATIEAYTQGVRQLAMYLKAQGRLAAPTEVTRADVQGFIADLLSRWSASTALTRYKAVRAFFQWMVDEGELERSPMLGVKPPKVVEQPPPVLLERDITKLLSTCKGQSFIDRRDHALIRLLCDSGARRGEIAGLLVTDVDFDRHLLLLHGKGGRDRVIDLGVTATRDLDRYIHRARPKHPRHDSPALWLGLRGPLSGPGILAMVKQRARQAGLDERVYAHLFRHTFADQWLKSGGREGDLMEHAGWKSRAMLDRYGASQRSERAREAHHQLSPGDRV